ncbi:ATP-grasp enzyme-like protein [Rhodococcus sp. AW25M09]|uniref:ATP-grasp enzyme-like protein n=1 Tax=Rhodococcus sp. AW25M09 TaxID=1268303 RepID=UPI0002ACF76B|nr:ATP-grasp enzyme-like protein [Rhodococcus sp. AW25M09]CCQ17928.1 ATP-grasp enzyme-like protein [Rhodococcus sp. AW25M09]
MIRTVAALVGLAVTLPVDIAAAGFAAIVGSRPTVHRTESPRTVLISGGKMTKALQLARSFHLAGHRVIMVESAKYRFTGHRFSRAVDRFHCVPEPGDSDYAQALLDIVQRENVDVFVPVASPAASIHDADAKALLDPHCEVIHGDSDTVRMVDDKSRFSEHAASLGLRVPDFRRITDPAQIEEFEFPPGREYILKRISYNPVGRMDLTRLSALTPERNTRFARSLHISERDPWILQEFIAGQEYCTHGTVKDGRLQVYCCCVSSAFQVNYEMVDKPEILSWVETFVSSLGVSGQLSFDFIESAADGHIYAIECNPRTHSAITMFYDHPDLAAAYLDDGHPVIVPRTTARPTYWIYHELWRLVTEGGRKARLCSIFRGTDAILAGWDPLPYLLVHHLQIPSLLVRNLSARRGWSRIDFNIGKLVENGGD